MELIASINEAVTGKKRVKDYVKLPRGEKTILEAEKHHPDDEKRGLIVELKEGGGYNIEYWYKDPSNVMPAEVKVDGKVVKADAKKVFLGFHPEMDEE